MDTHESGVTKLLIAAKATAYLVAFVASWTLLAILLTRFEPKLGFELPAIMRPVGPILIALGALIGLPCVYAFVEEGHGTPVPFDPPRRFVATGMYRHVRNPMFIGSFLALLGYGMFLLSASVVVLAFGALLVAHLFVVFVEEPGLERRFGDGYRLYKQSVGRWVPGFRPYVQ